MAEEEDLKNDTGNPEPRNAPKRPTKVRDIFTDRIVGIVSGAFVPVVLLFIPLVNKHLDNSKEIQELQIKSHVQDEEEFEKRTKAITGALVSANMQLQTVGQQLSDALAELKKANEELARCKTKQN